MRMRRQRTSMRLEGQLIVGMLDAWLKRSPRRACRLQCFYANLLCRLFLTVTIRKLLLKCAIHFHYFVDQRIIP